MANKIDHKFFFENRLIAILIFILLPVAVFAKNEIALPVYNPSFEDWNDAYPLFDKYTTSVPTGWDLGRTGYAPCDAVVKSHTRYSARTGEYAAFFNSTGYSNSIISNKYQLSEGTYTFSVYVANIGYGNTVLNLSVLGAVTKNAKFNVNGSNGSYTKYSLSFDMETNGDVQFKIDNSKEWDGNTTISHFSVDDWSLTTSDGKLIKSYDAVEINGISYYFYNNGNAEVIGVASNIASELTIPETVINNNQTYIVRDIAPYAFKDCENITKIILPKRLYNIGEAAFVGCSNLKVAILPTHLSSIGTNAFANCTGLNQVIVLAKSKPTISNGAFPENATLYVPDLKSYQSVHSKVSGMGFLHSDLYYTGVMPNISIVCPEGISYSSLDQSKLGKNAGAYTLNATFSGYGMSVDGSFEITINKAPLSVKAPTLTRIYGDTNPVIELVYSGFVNNETESDLNTKPQVTVNSTPKSDVGNYDIIISNATSPNYEISYTNGMLTVTQASLSIEVKNSTREYGVVNPIFSLNYTGLKNQETEPEWTTEPTFSTAALISSNVGQYDVSVSCVPKNYKIVENTFGVLTVTKAPLTLKANNKSKVYYELNPAFDYVLIGLRNQDDINCITQQPTFNCKAVQSSDCGEYAVTPINARATNYDIEHVSGVLTVQQAELTISVNNVICEYGEPIPQISYQLTGLKGSDNDSSIFIDRPSINCDAHIGSDAGEYAVTITGGATKNYNLKYNNGILTITKANQSIIWNQDLSNIELYSQVELTATSDANLPIAYEMSPNNVATLYSNAGEWYLDCYGSGAVNIRAIQNGDKNHNAATTVSKTLVVFGSGDDPSNPQIFLNVDEPGTLSSMIAESRKYQIKNLRLTGNLNGTDINFIREMAGSDSYGNSTLGVLETLDISGCTIISGGRSYYQSNRTSENVVGNYMFYNCKALTTLRIPDNTISIGDFALADCVRLSVISIPNCVTSYGDQSFRNDISLIRLPMSSELDKIGDMTFSGCNGLTEITIPSSVTSIGSGIVKDCQNIAQINVEAGNTNYASRDGVLFNSNLDELIIFPVNHSGSEYVVPAGVIKISSYAFISAKGLKSVSLPSSLSTIGQDAFIGCVNLNTLQVQALTPPTCQNDCFDNISKTRCELQVPIGCRSYYWVAPVWSEFNKIIETDLSGIEDVYYDNLQVGIINGRISVSGCPDNMTVRIYQINGTLIYQEQANKGEIEFEPASHGLYIVMIGNKAFKLMVK